MEIIIQKKKMTITFETKCWEKDWRYILCRGYLETMIENCSYKFDKKILYINNVDDISKVEKIAQKKIEKGIIDRYIIVDEHAERALNFFNIDKNNFRGGYYYSIAELVSIFLCETDYLLHFSSDACIVKDSYEWVKKTMSLMDEHKEYFVGNPTWGKDFEGAKTESFAETDENFIGFGFSDQCYLIRTEDFKKPIYNETNPVSERYPKYGGELFEKRVDAFMRNHNLHRITSKHTSYIHKNYPKESRFQKILDIFR
ncbi:hypothetical protein GGR21_001796 [Dysgonomonas hofstadii]|uniref:Uncharacterized protein n=1 Tax=Dysgonomonas hofstadii TaxID=637886 RepID=A0A840CL81_9BACT|nr:hypothetical protein [Dysgonomonas hofstadii]MBB4035901.1 hypothetical protein [Dysgonomonas hofstadii]